MDTDHIETAPQEPGRSRKELTASTVGAIVESFDWNIYAVLAPFFAAAVFGAGSSELLAAYAGFAVGFLARPLGSVLIGRFSDRHGRRIGLTVSMAAIAIASLCIALLPSAATIGAASAVLAVVFRVVQGLAYGGETPTVAAYVTEAAPRGMRWRFSAISYGGMMIGSLLAFGTITVLYAVFGKDGLSDGGWRWGFAIAAALGLLAIWVRRCAPESAAFERLKEEHGTVRPPVGTVLREHRWSCLALLGMSIAGTVPFYFEMIYLPVYAHNRGIVDKASASSYMTFVLAMVLVATLCAGWLADRIGPLVVVRTGFVVQALLTLPLLFAMQSHAVPFWAGALILGLMTAPVTMAINLVAGLLFPVEVRAVGAGLVIGVATMLFGGTFPLLAEWLHTHGGYPVLPFYVTAAAVVGLLGTFAAMRAPTFVQAMAAEPSLRRRPVALV
ncbi:MFS transporter [Tsukamurella sp. NPDC003166]|uniref:MFS transporter n=1 Tax=Tsukamurella sp. NPDC003166 TaxID=3154444 RepID=UPI00339F5EAF